MPLRSDGKISLCPLASGSKGNAWWVEACGTSALVDTGVSFKQLNLRAQAIGRDITQVDHVFLTHEHGDHVKGLSVLLKRCKPVVWASRGTLSRLRSMIPEGAKVRMLNGREEVAGGLRVRALPVSHDATQPLAYRFDTEEGAAAVITDLGQWDTITAGAVAGVDLLACEANHDPIMLQNGSYPWVLKQRVASPQGHLSNEDGAMLALHAAREGARCIFLSHLSEQNNSPSVARNVFQQHFERETLDTLIEVASQHHPGPWAEALEQTGTKDRR